MNPITIVVALTVVASASAQLQGSLFRGFGAAGYDRGVQELLDSAGVRIEGLRGGPQGYLFGTRGLLDGDGDLFERLGELSPAQLAALNVGGIRGGVAAARIAAGNAALGIGGFTGAIIDAAYERGLRELEERIAAENANSAGRATLAQVSSANTARNNVAARTAGAISASNTAAIRNANAISNANTAAANDAEALSEQIRLQGQQARSGATQAAVDQAAAVNNLASVRRAAFDANRAIISQRARNTAVNRRVNSAARLVAQVSAIRAGAFRNSAVQQVADDTQASRIAENANTAIVSQTNAINAGIPAAILNQTRAIPEALLANAGLRLRQRAFAGF